MPLSSAGSNLNFLSKLEEKNRSEVELDENLLVKSSSNRFSRLMKFLAKYIEIIENRSPDIKAGSGKTFTSFVTGLTFTAKATLVEGGLDKTMSKVPVESGHAWRVMMEIPIETLFYICWLTVMYGRA